ncbi:Beta-galactosidase C-terminal domain [Plantactinospora sp. KLBMP9567]|uniref:Beta-galactosidase C-terminal domain n=1 Tax=Plantactinospora sp. KLBMP9567 TaxID=3085900 RepID=UPI002981AC6F|nr:Beta-galactosidase C-terminal domain [Plantactinospora sp. KLBMP9567]MDW5322320.1 Beta-galactosidase C-terminal domain [Plantactinospora sp. KLBMP9567]
MPDLPEGLPVVRHGDDRSYLLLLNHGAEPVTVPLPRPAVDLLGERDRTVDTVTVAPRGVAVLRS